MCFIVLNVPSGVTTPPFLPLTHTPTPVVFSDWTRLRSIYLQSESDVRACETERHGPGSPLGGAAAPEQELKPEPLRLPAPPPPDQPHPHRGEARAARAGGVGNAQPRRSVCLQLRGASRSSLGSVFFFNSQRSGGSSTRGPADPAGGTAGTDPARLGSALKISDGGRTERSASRRPPARLPLFSRKMDGFAGSLGETGRRSTPEHHLLTCPLCGRVAGAARASGGFTRVTGIFIKEYAPPLRGLQGPKTNGPF